MLSLGQSPCRRTPFGRFHHSGLDGPPVKAASAAFFSYGQFASGWFSVHGYNIRRFQEVSRGS